MNVPTPQDVLAARDRIRDRIDRTPLVRSRWLSDATGGDVWLKLENQQREGSFKTRGAFNALLTSPVAEAVTASAGNHGRALAFAARALNVPLTVFVPRSAPRAKLDPIRRHGAALELCDSYDEAEARAAVFARERGVAYVSPYNNAGVIAGAGTVGLEIFEEDAAFDAVVTAVGGGGLISGVALAADDAAPGASIVGVEASASPVFTTALAAGRLVEVEVRPTLADGLAGNAEAGSITFDLVRDHGITVIAAGEAAIARAMRGLLEHESQTVEGAGAIGVAALLTGALSVKGTRVAVIVSGGNVDPGRLSQEQPHADRKQNERQ